MGSRLLIALRASIGLFILGCISIGLIGCPPPKWRAIKFLDGTKSRKEYNIRLANDFNKFTIRGDVGLSRNAIIRIFIEAFYEDRKSEHFKYRPSALKIFLMEKEMPYETTILSYQPTSQLRKEYISPTESLIHYYFETPIPSIRSYDSTGRSNPVEIKIVLDSFVYYNENLISIDTIRGILFGR